MLLDSFCHLISVPVCRRQQRPIQEELRKSFVSLAQEGDHVSLSAVLFYHCENPLISILPCLYSLENLLLTMKQQCGEILTRSRV